MVGFPKLAVEGQTKALEVLCFLIWHGSCSIEWDSFANGV
jgi:hypothetical protein